jgi:hypothetical protein
MSQNDYAPTGQVEAQLQSNEAQIVAPFGDNWQTFHQMGFYIHPLIQKGKKPFLNEWQRRASNDPTQLQEWAKQYPYSNIGIATELSGIVVIDCDTAKDKPTPQEWQIDGINDGADVLAYIAEQNGEHFPTNTLTVWTPNKGVHLYFKDEGKPIKQGAQVNGMWLVDTRSIGGNIVAPTSVLESGTYQMGEVTEIAPLPQWLRRAVSPRIQIIEQTTTIKRSFFSSGGDVLERQFQRLESAPNGTRNDTLASVTFICSKIVQTNSKIDAQAVMARLYTSALSAGLDKSEASATIKSCWKSALQKGGLRNV